MDSKTFVLIKFLILALVFHSGAILAQQDATDGYLPGYVKRGERPAIDLAYVPDSAMEPTRIQVKLSGSIPNYIDGLMAETGKDGYANFGIPALDNLNHVYKVARIERTFGMALGTKQYAERHRQWGFDRWFDLLIPTGTDIRKMVRDYAALAEVTHASPVYKIGISAGKNENPAKTCQRLNDNPAFLPSDSLFSRQWHYHNTGQYSGTPDADIDLPEAWEITKGDTNVIVAILDQGVSYSHTDLAGNMWAGLGFNFVTNTPDISPGDHGTHVAGTVAANTNNVTGVSGIAGGSGTGNGVRLMSCQILDASNSGNAQSAANAPIWAADHGAAISQNSWYFTTPNMFTQPILDAIDYFNVHGGGTVMTGGISIFCAGNLNREGLYYPGCYSGVVGVAATGNRDIKAWYSTYDTWVDISAPGGDGAGMVEREVLSTETNNSYGYIEGTSMACPHVSGVAALVLSMAPGPITSQELRDILVYSTDNIDSLNAQFLGKMGSGRLNAFNALQLTPAYIDPQVPKPPVGLTANTQSTTQINLAWTLNPASDTVLVVYNTSGTFGTPAGNYADGQQIGGGGTVIYKGIATTFSHLSLNPSTKYFYAIWSKNGANYSAVSRQTSASTLCNASPVPFVENFNSVFFPICWSQQNLGTGVLPKWFGSSTAHAGGLACEMMSVSQNVNPGTTRLVSAALNTTGLAQLNMSFRHMLDAKGVGITLKVQSSVDGMVWNDESFSIAATAADIPATLVSIPIINNLNSPTTYISFMVTGNLAQYDYWYIDDVVIETPSGTPPLVTTSPVTSITLNGAVTGGNVTLAGTSDVTARGVCWSTSANPNILNNHTSDGPGLGAFTSNIQGLVPNTKYYMRAYATNNTGTSYGSNLSFTTLCDVISSFPWMENFDNGGAIPGCWSQEVVGSSTITWKFITGNGGSNPATAHSGTYNASLKDNSPTDTKTRLLSPRFNLMAIETPVLTFWHTQQAFISYQDKLSVYYRNASSGNWNLLATYSGNISTWTLESITLPNPTNDYALAFEGNAKFGYGVCLDDIGISGVVPANSSLQNVTVGSTQCYNATQTIALAGDGTQFTVSAGGNATLIAGANILMYPGTVVDSGGYMHGYITQLGQFCGMLTPMTTSAVLSALVVPETAGSSLFRVYPNPTSGSFTIDLPQINQSETIHIEIYEMTGTRVLDETITGKHLYNLSLSGRSPGVYLLKIQTRETCYTKIIMKQ